MNLQEIMRQRRKINIILFLICISLATWIVVEFKIELKRAYQSQKPLVAQRITIIRNGAELHLQQQNEIWNMVKPYSTKASKVVVETLLERLKRGCRAIENAPARIPKTLAEIRIDDSLYAVGELNQASDEVYINNDDNWFLCDKLIASMALSDDINFIDKQLYDGTLKAIIGDFGRLTDFAGVDLSVMELAPANANALPQNKLTTLIFEADNTVQYQAFLHDTGEHILLFDEKKSIIYVVAYNDKLSSVLGL